jgi:hypothetical protein
MTQNARRFHLGDILSVTTGILLSPGEPPIVGVYKIMDHLTGQSLYTHQLVILADPCRKELLRQHPQLKNLVPPKKKLKWWLKLQIEKFGETLVITPMKDSKQRDPIADLVNLVGPERVVVFSSREPVGRQSGKNLE